MKLGLDIPAYWPDWSHPIENLFPEMIESAQRAEEIGFSTFALAEHHFIDYFVMPAPLAFASHLAAVTKSARLMIAVVDLPINDVRRVAGEITVADHLTKGRLDVGLGRGSNRYEPHRMGVEFDELREIFEEKLEALLALLTEQECLPRRPVRQVPSAYDHAAPVFRNPTRRCGSPASRQNRPTDAARRGFNVQTASLRRSFDIMHGIVQAFRDGAAGFTAEKGGANAQQVSMGTWVYVVRDPSEDQGEARDGPR